MLKVAVLPLLLLASCATTTHFQPYRASTADLTAVTQEAVIVYPGDINTFLQCDLVYVGSLQCSPTCQGTLYFETSKSRYGYKLPEYAALLGATHLALVQRQWTRTGTKTSASSTYVGYGVSIGSAETHETGFSTETWDLFRVDSRRQYLCLDPALRPDMEF